MKKLILIVLIMLAIILSTTAVIVTQTKQDEAAIEATESNVKEEIFNAHAIAIQFILKGYEEEVRLYTSQMENTNNDGKIAFLIEAEGVNSLTHNLFIIVVKNERVELIKQLI
jgi:uncharacterized protein YxeA